MPNEATFMEDEDGVHVMNIVGGEHTLCGTAFDAHESGDSSAGPLRDTNKKVVSCPWCSQIIMSIKKIECRPKKNS